MEIQAFEMLLSGLRKRRKPVGGGASPQAFSMLPILLLLLPLLLEHLVTVAVPGPWAQDRFGQRDGESQVVVFRRRPVE